MVIRANKPARGDDAAPGEGTLAQGGTSLTLAGLNTNDLFEIIGVARSMARLKSSSLSPQ